MRDILHSVTLLVLTSDRCTHHMTPLTSTSPLNLKQATTRTKVREAVVTERPRCGPYPSSSITCPRTPEAITIEEEVNGLCRHR